MKTFPTKRTRDSQNFPFPERGETVYENPVTFIWVPVDDAEYYTVKLYDKNRTLLEKITSNINNCTSSTKLEAGEYLWTVETDTGLLREEYYFTLSENALFFDRPTAKEVFDAVPCERPRHLFFKSDIKKIKLTHTKELECLERNVKIALERPLPTPPMFHRDPNALPYREYFGAYRDVCDRDMVALAEYYALTGNMEAGEKAKEIFLEIYHH